MSYSSIIVSSRRFESIPQSSELLKVFLSNNVTEEDSLETRKFKTLVLGVGFILYQTFFLIMCFTLMECVDCEEDKEEMLPRYFDERKGDTQLGEVSEAAIVEDTA